MISNESKMMFLIANEEPKSPTKNYIRALSISKTPILYQNNSLEKSERKRKDKEKKYSDIKEKLQKLKNQASIALKAKTLREYQQKLDTLAVTQINKYYHNQELAISSVIKIQKTARGFLIRKHFNESYIRYKENQLHHIVNDLQDATDYCFFYLGTNTLPVIHI